MKKLTVMAACAALLLGGGCFLKSNNDSQTLLESKVEALSDNDVYKGEENYPIVGYDKDDVLVRDRSTGTHVTIKCCVRKNLAAACVPANQDSRCNQ